MGRILDDTDRRIVAALQKDGRMSNVEMARRLGLAEATVRKRLERLVASGIIRVAAIVEPTTVGLPTRMMIGIEADLSQVEAIAGRLAAVPEVCSVGIVAGSYDIIIEVVLPSSAQLLSFILDKVAAIPGIKRTETYNILKVVKQPTDWALPDEPSPESQERRPGKTPPRGGVVPGAIVVPS